MEAEPEPPGRAPGEGDPRAARARQRGRDRGRGVDGGGQTRSEEDATESTSTKEDETADEFETLSSLCFRAHLRSSAAHRSSAQASLRQHVQHDVRRELRRAIHPLRRLLEVASFASKMFGTYFCGLRSISGNQVLCTCTMILCPLRKQWWPQCRSIVYSSTSPGTTGSGFSKLLRNRARTGSPLIEQLIAAHVRVFAYVLRVDVDQPHDPVAVGAGRRGEQLRRQRAGDGHVLRRAARSRRSARRGGRA